MPRWRIRVVQDGTLITCAGVTAGIDGALRAVALLCSQDVAQAIQLYLEYAPEPPFHTGHPRTAPPELVAARREALRGLLEQRLAVVKRAAAKLGLG